MNQTTELTRRIDIAAARENARDFVRREWLLANGLGGYASGTISGRVTRRYHGLLVAALPAPLGRVVMFNHLAESLHLPGGKEVGLAGEEADDDSSHPQPSLTEFRLEMGIPVWRYEAPGVVIERRLLLIHGQNTVHLSYRLLEGPDCVELDLRPSFHFRPHESDVSEAMKGEYMLSVQGSRYEIASGPPYPPLRLTVREEGTVFTHHGGSMRELGYATESERGYSARGPLWSPGYFTLPLRPGRAATLVASTEPWETILALEPAHALASELERRRRLVAAADPRAQHGASAELVLAADQFLITPAGRVQDAARARASGDEVRTVIAGYHWFTDWGRDTMISLEGLTLTTGRHAEAGWLLRTFGHYIRDGLLPNLFPEGESEGLYHTADATLWFFHALDRYLQSTGDRTTLQALLPKLVDIVTHHQRGTRFGIGVDPADGLLRQGQDGYQLTWMDAKVEGWVVTPRRGKAVEINALWYNALRLLEGWLREEGRGDEAAAIGHAATQVRESFNRRFWSPERGHLLDIVDGEHGDDPACRPNQIFAVSLRHAVLDEAHWKAVVEKVRSELLTPVGLRSLSRSHPDFKSRYFGDLRARDAAYHQGTVWAWLVGPFVDAWLRVHPEDRAGARRFLDGLLGHLDHACIGSISEIFDAEEPFTARGCIAQAWSVAEVLRCLVLTAEPPAAPGD